jgi:hypothetical protein
MVFNLPDKRAVQFTYLNGSPLPYIILSHGDLGRQEIPYDKLREFSLQSAYDVAVKKEGPFDFKGVSVYYTLAPGIEEPYYAFLLSGTHHILVGVLTHKVIRV